MLLMLALLPAMALSILAMPESKRDTAVSSSSEPVMFAVNAIKEQFAQKNGGSVDLVEVVDARTQAMTGKLLYLTLHLTGDVYCNVSVWQRNDNRLEIIKGPACTQQQNLREKRSLEQGVPGGVSAPRKLPKPGHPDHFAVHEALYFATCAANDRLDTSFAVKLAFPIGIKYTQQVTAGMTYRFYNVPLAITSCRNEGCNNLDLSACNIIKMVGRQVKMCSFEVHFQAWMRPQYNLIDMSCINPSMAEHY